LGCQKAAIRDHRYRVARSIGFAAAGQGNQPADTVDLFLDGIIASIIVKLNPFFRGVL
jgi:hypothetical protein